MRVSPGSRRGQSRRECCAEEGESPTLMLPQEEPIARFDYIVVGGGLQGALLVLAIHDLQPEARVALVEAEHRLGGNHTWCFHDTDIAPTDTWIQPLVAHHWDGYEVRFPGFRRHIPLGYNAIPSDHLDGVLRRHLEDRTGSELSLGRRATRIEPEQVELDDGRTLRSRAVVVATGPGRLPTTGSGFQRFLGMEVTLHDPHDLPGPLLMDAEVDQTEGFRFLYVLPFGPRRVLVEDTCFHDDPHVHPESVRRRIHDWIRNRDWEIETVEREEIGVLPMPWDDPGPRVARPLRAGYAGGWFHPATGYSLPVAVRLARFVAERSPEDLHGPPLEDLAREVGRQAAYGRRLNDFLFRWFSPADRHHLFSRFYRLPLDRIARFYALGMRADDRARILCGQPPRGMSLRRRIRRMRTGTGS